VKESAVRVRTIVLVAIAALLPACSVFAGALPDAAEGDWQLTEGTVGGQDLQVPAGVRITLSIEGDEVGGNNSCNSYFGRIDTSGGRLSITELGQTEMACPDVMDLEATYMQALQAVTDLEVADDSLHLTGPDVDLRFARVEPLPTSDLVGTTWTLESLLMGEVASSVGGDPGTLELTQDGQLSGSTGCRTFSGTYEVSGDTVTVTQLVTDDRACPAELQQQDDHVLAVLGDGFTVQIAENRLTVLSAGDQTQGLDYRAG
jgi:heat shock protein HslJ